MRCLVVGGNGYIGSHLVNRLVAEGWDVTILDQRERRYEALPAGVKHLRYGVEEATNLVHVLDGMDVVYHLAWTTIHELSNRDPQTDVNSNLIPSIQLLDASRQAGVGRFVFVSSGGTVYGPAGTIPIPETAETNPINSYGITKLAVEKYLQMYHHLYGLDFVILRPSVPYGPLQNPLGRQGVVPVFLYRVGHELPITIYGDGTVTRDYFYITDQVEALRLAGTQPLGQERLFNIGGGSEISLLELLAKVVQVTGKRAIVDFKPARSFDAPRISLDIRLAKERLGWAPQVSMDEGLERTWTWIQTKAYEVTHPYPPGAVHAGENGKNGHPVVRKVTV